MKYYYEKTKKPATKGRTYTCNHPVYNSCTLYLNGSIGLSVVQKRFNKLLKLYWWGPIDSCLVDDIYNHPRFFEVFVRYAKEPEDDIYPTITVRKLMWALRMKPLAKEEWEFAEKTGFI